ncbi:uncharacterized protein LOC109726957 isoform X2 [Ananas comosus]|uniref:Uncharacterized protein LOC109726957 isoform X2 n=1 Tax=Ananas comosus TaxID=4615 RepID=A0A6P5GX47_ANACO|nr:uncharacterized protein LOC109726957 isoform X2 [Ananas comosus]
MVGKMAIGTKWQQQTTSYNQSFEGTLQIARDFNQNLDILAQRIETLRKEEARRYEIMMEEEARRHEQLLELIRSRFVHAREEEITVQVPKEEKKLIPIPIPLEKRVSSLTNSVIDQPAAVKEVEQKHKTSLQIEANRMCKVKLRDSVSKPEELLKPLAAQPPLFKPAHNALNAYAASTKFGSTAEAAKNIAHNSKESIDYYLIEGAVPSEQTKTQGLSDGEEFITGKQCENSSLHLLPAQKKGALGAESETAKEGCEPQQVEEGNAYDAVIIKESNNQALLSLVDDRSLHSLIDFGAAKATKVGSTTFAPLIVKAGPEKLDNSYYPQFAKKEQGHQPLADSRKSRLKGSDTALGIDEMQKYKQVPFDPGPNEGTTHSIEGVRQDHNVWAKLRELRLEGLDRVPRTDWLKTYKPVLCDLEQDKVTIPNVEGVSHIPIITSELPMVIKHRAQVIVVRPYWIKPEATMEKTHACIQKPHREITDSTQKKEIVAILLEVNSQFHAKSFPRMDFLMFSGNNLRNWIGGYEQCFELHQINNQQEVEFAPMLRQQERSQDLRNQMLSPIISMTEACHVWNYVNLYKKLGTVLKMPHPCSRFLAYEQDKLQESDYAGPHSRGLLSSSRTSLSAQGDWDTTRKLTISGIYKCCYMCKKCI